MSLSCENQRPIVADKILAIAVYALYGLGYFTVITAAIGVSIAHAMASDADPVAQSHFRFQIRTFWIGVLYNAIGWALFPVMLIGLPILGWWFAWSLARIVQGGLLAVEDKPIANPTSWLFG